MGTMSGWVKMRCCVWEQFKILNGHVKRWTVEAQMFLGTISIAPDYCSESRRCSELVILGKGVPKTRQDWSFRSNA